MGGHQLPQRGFPADQQQAGEGRHARAVRLARGEQQGAVEGLVVQLQQHAVAAVLLHRLAQAFALQRVEVGQRGTGHRLGRDVDQAEAACAAAALMGQHGHAFRGAVVFQAAAQVDAAGGGHLTLGLGHLDARHDHAVQFDRLGLYV
ncbi:hypothetical protein D9M68_880260 [compost metagenome]